MPKPSRSSRIGPFGPDVEIRWSTHAADRFVERYQAKGIDRAKFDELIRNPNIKKQDVHDPCSWEDRYRRWIGIDLDGERTTVRVVFTILRPGSDSDPGAIRIVSVMHRDDRRF